MRFMGVGGEGEEGGSGSGRVDKGDRGGEGAWHGALYLYDGLGYAGAGLD